MDTCKDPLDTKEVAGALQMGLSKAFGCIEHESLIAKVNAYGSSKKGQLMIYNRIQEKTKTKIKWFTQ